MNMRVLAAFVVLAVVTAVFAGCGHSNGNTGTLNGALGALSNAVDEASKNLNSGVSAASDALASALSSAAAITESAGAAVGTGALANVSVAPPSGWINSSNDGASIAYICADPKMLGSSFAVTAEALSGDKNTASDYAAETRGELLQTNTAADLTDVSKTSVNGMDAAEFTYTVSGMKMKMRFIYIVRGGNAYTVMCNTVGDDLTAADPAFESILASLKISG